MKISTGKTAGRATFAVFGGIALFGSTNAATAQKISRGPVISPSIIAAHRLKYYPPRGWIRHYLGDDRYKVGSVWRVVTTPNDKFYYPPFAREMLMAPPDQIIGFASAQDAQEAGYAPASQYGDAFGMDARQMAVADAQNNPETSSGASSNVTTVNRTKKSQRIVLADGASSVLLPPNWQRVISTTSSPIPNSTVWSDVLTPMQGKGVLSISVVNEFPNASVEQGTSIQIFNSPRAMRVMTLNSARTMRRLTAAVKAAKLRETGNGQEPALDRQDAAYDRYVAGLSFGSVRLGKFNWTRVSSKRGTIVIDPNSFTGSKTNQRFGLGFKNYVMALDDKGYQISDSTNTQAAISIINSLRPR